MVVVVVMVVVMFGGGGELEKEEEVVLGWLEWRNLWRRWGILEKMEVDGDGFWVELKRRRRNLGLMKVEEGCGVMGGAAAAAWAAPEVVVVMVEAACVSGLGG